MQRVHKYCQSEETGHFSNIWSHWPCGGGKVITLTIRDRLLLKPAVFFCKICILKRIKVNKRRPGFDELIKFASKWTTKLTNCKNQVIGQDGLPNARTQKALVLIRFCKTCQPFNKYWFGFGYLRPILVNVKLKNVSRYNGAFQNSLKRCPT